MSALSYVHVPDTNALLRIEEHRGKQERDDVQRNTPAAES